MPLKALLDNQPFYGWSLDESYRKSDFSCPFCEVKMIPVLPSHDIIRHFRHKEDSCQHEPETKEHINGKKYLYDLLKARGYKTELEVKLGWHICDVLVKHNNVPVAIEYQCSPITSDEITNRGQAFNSAGCELGVWVLGGHYYKHATAFQTIGKKDKRADPIWDFINQSYEYETYDYEIQRILKIEERLLHQPLIYLHDRQFYLPNWSYRYKAETLGWYNLRQVHEGHFLKIIRGLVNDF